MILSGPSPDPRRLVSSAKIRVLFRSFSKRIIQCTGVYLILRAAVAQKQLAKFKNRTIFFEAGIAGVPTGNCSNSGLEFGARAPGANLRRGECDDRE
jgi:hypothetical protein